MRGMKEALADVSLIGLYAQEHQAEIAGRRAAIIERMDDLKGWIGQLEVCTHGDPEPRVGVIDVPFLVTASDRDTIVALPGAQEIHAAIAGSRLVVSKGPGMPHASNVPGSLPKPVWSS